MGKEADLICGIVSVASKNSLIGRQVLSASRHFLGLTHAHMKLALYVVMVKIATATANSETSDLFAIDLDDRNLVISGLFLDFRFKFFSDRIAVVGRKHLRMFVYESL
jgi:hypothetical protein